MSLRPVAAVRQHERQAARRPEPLLDLRRILINYHPQLRSREPDCRRHVISFEGDREDINARGRPVSVRPIALAGYICGVGFRRSSNRRPASFAVRPGSAVRGWPMIARNGWRVRGSGEPERCPRGVLPVLRRRARRSAGKSARPLEGAWPAATDHLVPRPLLRRASWRAHRARSLQEQGERKPARWRSVRLPIVRLGEIRVRVGIC